MTLSTQKRGSSQNLESSEGRRFNGAAAPPCGHTRKTQEGKRGRRRTVSSSRKEEKTEKNSNVLPGKSLIPPQLHHMTFPKENATL